MKKVLISILMFSLVFVLAGCGKEKGEPVVNYSDDIESNDIQDTNNSEKETYDDIDLYSDSTKIVFKNGQVKLVYYYSGDTITAYHTYLDYEDAVTAKLALNLIDKDDLTIKKAYTKGKYLVVEYNESEYENMTVSELKALYSYLEEIKK